jgi:hypothetical protein
MRGDGKPLARTTAAPLHKVQNDCLRRITGAYKRTPRAAMEQETRVMPIDLHMEISRYKQVNRTKRHQVEAQIARTADVVWRRMRRTGSTHVRPVTGREAVAVQASERVQEMEAWGQWCEEEKRRRSGARNPQGPRRRSPRSNPRPPQHQSEAALIKKWGELTWRKRWEAIARGPPGQRVAAVWRTPWTQDPRQLYAGLSKAEATALFLMRTEVIGLNAWLAAVYVPDVSPACPCGWHVQTVRHVLLHCPRHSRENLLIACGTEQFDDILMRPECTKHAARWLVHTGVLEQFRVAAEVAKEKVEEYQVFPEAEEW